MPGRLSRKEGWLLAAWAVPFLGFVVVLCYLGPQLKDDAKPRENLKVYSNTKYYRELDRSKAAEFGLEKIFSLVNYLLLATAAVLAFLTKSLMEFRAERVKASTAAPVVSPPRGQLLLFLHTGVVALAPYHSSGPPRGQLLLFLHAGIACFFSLTCGMLAFLTMPDVAVRATFAVTGQLSWCVVCQIGGLLFSALLLLVALGGMVRGLLP
jgi:hypothetical protein